MMNSGDQVLVTQLTTMAFTDAAQNLVLIGRLGTGKKHQVTAMVVAGIVAKGARLFRVACFDASALVVVKTPISLRIPIK